MLEVNVNLISQEQIYHKRLHQLSISYDEICIDSKGIFTQLIKNNLYIMDIAGLFVFDFPSINKDTIKTWHAQLVHLEWQNIIWLTKRIANSIDLIKSLPYSACKLCSIENFQAEPYCDKIKPGLKPLDLVHSDVTSPFIEGLYGATQFVTFLYDVIKRFEVVRLIKKNGVLPTFKGCYLHHKKGVNVLDICV